MVVITTFGIYLRGTIYSDIVWARGAACARGRNDFADKTAAVNPSWPYIVVGVPVFTIITITTIRDDIHATNKQQQIVV